MVKLGDILDGVYSIHLTPLSCSTELRRRSMPVPGTEAFMKKTVREYLLSLEKLKYFFSLNVCVKMYLNVYINLYILQVPEISSRGKTWTGVRRGNCMDPCRPP